MYACVHRCTRPVVSAKVQSEERLANWQKQVRRKVLRKRYQTKRQTQHTTQPKHGSLESKEPPADALHWRGEPWKEHRHELAELQRQIYTASLNKDSQEQLTSLQTALLSSQAAKSLAVRRVALNHPQRRIPGVDGIHSLDEAAQITLRDRLTIDGVADPFEFHSTARAWKEIRSGRDDEGMERVCVCTMRDRAKQVLLSWALEPAFEATFSSSNVLGHRPGRSAKDFIKWLRATFNGEPQYAFVIHLSIDSQQKITDFLTTQFSIGVTQLLSWIDAGLLELGLYPVGIGKHGQEHSCPLLPLISNLICHHLMQFTAERHGDIQMAAFNGTLIAVGSCPDELTNAHSTFIEASKAIGLMTETFVPIQAATEWIDILQFRIKQEMDDACRLCVRLRSGVLDRHLSNLTTVLRLSNSFFEDKAGLINRLNRVIHAFVDYFSAADVDDDMQAANQHLKKLLIQWSHTTNVTLPRTETLKNELHGKHNNAESSFEFKAKSVQLLKHSCWSDTAEDLPSMKSPYDGDEAYWKAKLRHWEYAIWPSFL